jgi:hypothetical protein
VHCFQTRSCTVQGQGRSRKWAIHCQTIATLKQKNRARIIIPPEISETRDRSAHGSDMWSEIHALCIENQQGDEDQEKVWREVEHRAREHQARYNIITCGTHHHSRTAIIEMVKYWTPARLGFGIVLTSYTNT